MFHLTLFSLLVSMLSLASAAPVEVQGHGDAWRYGTGGGIIGFVVLILDIIVFIEVLQSTHEVLPKVLWCLLVFLFPIGGLIIYFLFSNRNAHKRGYEVIPS